MNFLSFLIGVLIFSGLLVLAFWIGFYIVLPIVLIALIVSSISSLIKVFVPSSPKKQQRHYVLEKNNRIIDVEFEEIR